MFQSLQREVGTLYELVMLALGRTGSTAAIFGPWAVEATAANSPYTPAAGVAAVPFNTVGGGVTINMPANPTNGQMFFVKPTLPSATPATIAATGVGVTVEDPSNPCNFGATGTVPGQGSPGASGSAWKFRAADSKWIGFPGF